MGWTGAELLTFVVTTTAVMAMPGVTVSSITGTTLAHGVAAGLVMELGAVLARISMLLLLALGLEAISHAMAALFDVVKLAGAAYLVWLGIKTIRNPPALKQQSDGARGLWRQAVSGFIILWGNPKALLFFGAFIPQFIDVGQPIAPQIAFLGAIWIVVVIITDCTYILLAGGARKLFSGAFARRIGWVSGAVLIAAGVWLAFQQKA